MKSYFLSRSFFTLDESPQPASWIQKLAAHITGGIPFLMGRCESWKGYNQFYLSWCRRHRFYFITCETWFEGSLRCHVCDAEDEQKLALKPGGKPRKSARRDLQGKPGPRVNFIPERAKWKDHAVLNRWYPGGRGLKMQIRKYRFCPECKRRLRLAPYQNYDGEYVKYYCVNEKCPLMIIKTSVYYEGHTKEELLRRRDKARVISPPGGLIPVKSSNGNEDCS